MSDFSKWGLPSANEYCSDLRSKMGYLPYSNDFIREESIHYRLWMWRYRCDLRIEQSLGKKIENVVW